MMIGFVFVLPRDCGCTNSERFLYRTSFGLGKYLPSQRNDRGLVVMLSGVEAWPMRTVRRNLHTLTCTDLPSSEGPGVGSDAELPIRFH